MLPDPVPHHRSQSTPAAASLQPTIQQPPPSIEGYSIPPTWNNPSIPPNESPSYLRPTDNPRDPNLRIFRTIEDQNDDTLQAIEPLIGGCCTYGTVFVDDADPNFDPYLHPRIIGIMLGRYYIGRWREVDNIIRSRIFSAYNGNPPPIRYYVEDWELIADDSRSQHPIFAHGDIAIPKRVDVGHSIGSLDPFSCGTLGCMLRLRDLSGSVLPEMYGLTCHHVISQDHNATPVTSNTNSILVRAPAFEDYTSSTNQ